MVAPKIKDKKKPVAVKKVPQNIQWEFSHAIAFWGLAILLFLPPYFRGLFFQPEQERALIFAAIIFWFAWLWKWSKRDNSFLSHLLDYFVLAFPVVNLISAFQAANYGLAVDEVVKTTLYFMVYWLSSRLVRNDKDIVTILNVIYISAIGVALAGLATATGIININDGFYSDRFASSFQYPNALASFLAAATFIGLYLWRGAGSPEPGGAVSGTVLKGVPDWLTLSSINQYLYAAGNFLLFAVLLGTKSQGGILVFGIVLALFVIGLPRGNRIPVIIHFILYSIPSFIAILRFLSAVAGNKMDLAWLWIFIGLALVLAGQVIYSFGERKGFFQWIAIHKNIVLAAIMLVIISGCIGAGVYISGHSDIVKNLVEEIKFHSIIDRMYFFHDAIKMFKEHPVLGWGGGGWQEAYRAYQSFLYNSNQVHGYYLQIMVEVGLLGLLAILGIWISFLLAAHRAYHGSKTDTARRLLVWMLTVVALTIGLHAAIDFDLSLSALALVLWTIFGLMRYLVIFPCMQEAGRKGNKKTYVPTNNALLASVTVACFAIILFAGALASANEYARQAGKYLQKQNINQGINMLQKASVYNIWNADYRSNLVRIYQQTGKLDEGLAEAQKAISLSKYSAPRYADLAGFSLRSKKHKEAVGYAEKALMLAPFQVQWYELLARTCFIVGYNDLNAGDRDSAKQYLEKAAGVPGRIEEKMATLSETEKKRWVDASLMTVTPAVNLNAGAAKYMLGFWPEAEVCLQGALRDEKSEGEATLWLAVLRDKQGKPREAQDLLGQAQKIAPELAKGYEGMRAIQVLH